MAERQGVLVGRRRLSTLGWRGENLDWWLALAAVAIGIAGYLIGDRTNWTGGFGYDGRLYGELGLVNLLQLIPSMESYYRQKGYAR